MYQDEPSSESVDDIGALAASNLSFSAGGRPSERPTLQSRSAFRNSLGQLIVDKGLIERTERERIEKEKERDGALHLSQERDVVAQPTHSLLRPSRNIPQRFLRPSPLVSSAPPSSGTGTATPPPVLPPLAIPSSLPISMHPFNSAHSSSPPSSPGRGGQSSSFPSSSAHVSSSGISPQPRPRSPLSSPRSANQQQQATSPLSSPRNVPHDASSLESSGGMSLNLQQLEDSLDEVARAMSQQSAPNEPEVRKKSKSMPSSPLISPRREEKAADRKPLPVVPQNRNRSTSHKVGERSNVLPTLPTPPQKDASGLSTNELKNSARQSQILAAGGNEYVSPFLNSPHSASRDNAPSPTTPTTTSADISPYHSNAPMSRPASGKDMQPVILARPPSSGNVHSANAVNLSSSAKSSSATNPITVDLQNDALSRGSSHGQVRTAGVLGARASVALPKNLMILVFPNSTKITVPVRVEQYTHELLPFIAWVAQQKFIELGSDYHATEVDDAVIDFGIVEDFLGKVVFVRDGPPPINPQHAYPSPLPQGASCQANSSYSPPHASTTAQSPKDKSSASEQVGLPASVALGYGSSSSSNSYTGATPTKDSPTGSPGRVARPERARTVGDDTPVLGRKTKFKLGGIMTRDPSANKQDDASTHSRDRERDSHETSSTQSTKFADQPREASQSGVKMSIPDKISTLARGSNNRPSRQTFKKDYQDQGTDVNLIRTALQADEGSVFLKIKFPLDYPINHSTKKYDASWTCDELIKHIQSELVKTNARKLECTGKEALFIQSTDQLLPRDMRLSAIDPADRFHLTLLKDASSYTLRGDLEKLNKKIRQKEYRTMMNQEEVQRLTEAQDAAVESVRASFKAQIAAYVKRNEGPDTQTLHVPSDLAVKIQRLIKTVEESYEHVLAFQRQKYPASAWNDDRVEPLNRADLPAGLKECYSVLDDYTLSQLNAPNRNMTPLIVAVRSGQLDMVVALINRGADINFKPEGPETVSPLQAALVANQEKVLAVLLAAGVDLEAVRAEVDGSMSLGLEAFLIRHPNWKPLYVYLNEGLHHLGMQYPFIYELTAMRISKRKSGNFLQMMNDRGVWDYSPLELAELLTCVDQKLVDGVPLSEFGNPACFAKAHLSPYLSKLAGHFNTLSNAVSSLLLTETNATSRECLLISILKTINELANLNNYQSFFALASAVFSPSIMRLKCFKSLKHYTHSPLLKQPPVVPSVRVYEEARALIADIDALMDPTSNYDALRKRIAAIPEGQFGLIYIGLLQKDVIYFESMKQRAEIESLFQKVKRMAAYPFPAQTNVYAANERIHAATAFSFIDKFLEHVWSVPELEEVNHELSQFLEPKDKKAPLSPNERRRTQKAKNNNIKTNAEPFLPFGDMLKRQRGDKKERKLSFLQKQERDRLGNLIVFHRDVNYETEICDSMMAGAIADLFVADSQHFDITLFPYEAADTSREQSKSRFEPKTTTATTTTNVSSTASLSKDASTSTATTTLNVTASLQSTSTKASPREDLSVALDASVMVPSAAGGGLDLIEALQAVQNLLRARVEKAERARETRVANFAFGNDDSASELGEEAAERVEGLLSSVAMMLDMASKLPEDSAGCGVDSLATSPRNNTSSPNKNAASLSIGIPSNDPTGSTESLARSLEEKAVVGELQTGSESSGSGLSHLSTNERERAAAHCSVSTSGSISQSSETTTATASKEPPKIAKVKVTRKISLEDEENYRDNQFHKCVLQVRCPLLFDQVSLQRAHSLLTEDTIPLLRQYVYRDVVDQASLLGVSLDSLVMAYRLAKALELHYWRKQLFDHLKGRPDFQVALKNLKLYFDRETDDECFWNALATSTYNEDFRTLLSLFK